MSLRGMDRSAITLVSSEQMQMENSRFVTHVDLGFSISSIRPEDSEYFKHPLESEPELEIELELERRTKEEKEKRRERRETDGKILCPFQEARFYLTVWRAEAAWRGDGKTDHPPNCISPSQVIPSEVLNDSVRSIQDSMYGHGHSILYRTLLCALHDGVMSL